MKISVIICTYNPRKDYLDRVLDALKNQSLDKKNWELIVVDNNSDQKVADGFDIRWHPNGKHVIETEPGLTPARLKGIEVSKGELLIFVDDDNVLDARYLENAKDAFNSNPNLGAIGGSILPEYEVPPSADLKKHTGKLALRTVDKVQLSNLYINKTTPYGAGLIIKNNVAQKYAENLNNNSSNVQLDRKGDSLMSSGDLDLAYTALDMGFVNGLFPKLKVIHLIPKERTKLEYLLRLRRGVNLSGMLLKYYRFNTKPQRPHPLKRTLSLAINKLRYSHVDWLMTRESYRAYDDFEKITGMR